MTRLDTPDPASTTAIDSSESVVSVAVALAKPSKPQTTREFERALRGLGFSQREAAGISLHGFNKATGDAAGAPNHAELSELAALIAKTHPF